MFGKLYQGIQSGEIRTDEEGAQLLYGAPDVTPTFRAIKSRLRRRLMNVIFFLDLDGPEDSERMRALQETEKDRYWTNMLMIFGANLTAIKIAESGLALSEKYEFYSTVLELQQVLRSQYSRLGNKKKFSHYSNAAHLTLKRIEAELKAAEIYENFAVELAYAASPRPDLAQYAEECARDLRRLKEEQPSFKVHLSYYRMSNIATQIVGKFEETIQTSREAIAYLTDHPHLTTPSRIGEFLIDELESCIFLRRYEEGQIIADECRVYNDVGKNNWFIFMEQYFLLAMHTLHFENALDILTQVIGQPRLAVQPDLRKEKWRIFELYIRFLFPDEKLPKSLLYPRKRTFSLRNFLRQVPTYAKDKQGFNVAILVAQILYLADRKDYTKIIDRVLALRTYQSRYLKTQSNRQSHLFLKMLERAVARSFDREETIKSCEALHEQLRASTANYYEVTDTLQILPLDWVWEKILEGLPD